MANDRKNPGSVDRAQWTFGQLLQWHVLRGTRSGGKIDQPGRKWTTNAFAEAVGFEPRTVRYWLKNEHLPPETETIERILFGNDACYYAEWRLELRQAHARRSSAKYEDGSAILTDNFTERHSEAGRTFSASNIPIRVPIHFMGRNDALAKIDAALRRYMGRVAITALHGLRGLGKTTLAAAYAERHRINYRATWWIGTFSDATGSSFIMLGGSLTP